MKKLCEHNVLSREQEQKIFKLLPLFRTLFHFLVTPSPRDVLTGRSADLRGDQTLEKDVRCALPVGLGAAHSAAAHTSSVIHPAAADRETQGH